MDIRKADNKGRISGLKPGEHYHFSRAENGVVVLSPLRADTPIHLTDTFKADRKEAIAYLESFGLDPHMVLLDGISHSGYDSRGNISGTRERRSWPEGFDIYEFTRLIFGEKSGTVN